MIKIIVSLFKVLKFREKFMAKKEIIKLKKEDLNKAIVRGLSHAAWEAKKNSGAREQTHLNPKRRVSRYKEKLENLDTEN